MVQWARHLTKLGKVVVVALAAVGIAAAVVVVYLLLGPAPIETSSY